MLYNDHAEIILEDRKCNERARVKISLDKVELVTPYKWRLTNTGYATTNINKKQLRLHNLIMNTPEGYVVDHINRNPLDCRNENLRICKTKENARNLSLSKNNTSGVTGVYWDNSKDKWFAQIMVDRINIHLGSFISFEKAVKARKEAEIKYFGEYAPT